METFNSSPCGPDSLKHIEQLASCMPGSHDDHDIIRVGHGVSAASCLLLIKRK